MKKYLLLAVLAIAVFCDRAQAQFNECAGEIITSFAGGRSFDFIYQSSGLAHPDFYIWDYGDGVADTTQFAYHTYAGPGGYSVTCTVISIADSCTFTAQDSVFIQGTGSCRGEVLVFRQGNYFTAVAHRTGGSNTATYQWTTPASGTYYSDNTITNYIPDSLLTDTLKWCVQMADHWVSGCVVDACVKVPPGAVLPTRPCHAFFTIEEDTAMGGRNYILYNYSTGTGLYYTWTFGDGAISHAAAPTHTYADTGSYTICLSVYDSVGNCLSSYCDSSMLGIGNRASAVTIRVVPVTGTKGSIRQKLTMWPVPARDVLHFSTPLKAYSLHTLAGQSMQTGALATDAISVRGLLPGTYLLKGQTASGPIQRLVVVER